VSGNKKDRNVENIFFFFSSDPLFHMKNCVFISTYCNINVILALIATNNIKKKLVMIAAHYGNQITTNYSIISIIINNIDSNH